MVSKIDPTRPAGPVAYTADVRANFAAAKMEIETLQNVLSNGDSFLPTTGGEMEGPLVLHADPVAPMEASTRQYVDASMRDYLAALPSTDAGLVVGDLFWSGGFLCKKIA